MSRKSTHRARDRDGALESLERQQSIVLEALRAATGRPVSYEQLRDAGVEFPASVVSELELAGVQVERCRERVGGTRQVVGVRLYAAPHAAYSPDPPALRPRSRVAPRPALRAGARGRRPGVSERTPRVSERPRYPPAPEGPPRTASPGRRPTDLSPPPSRAPSADGVPETLSMPTISIPRVSPAKLAVPHVRVSALRVPAVRAPAVRPRVPTLRGRLAGGSLARAVFLATPAAMVALVLWALAASVPGGSPAHTRDTTPSAHVRELAPQPASKSAGAGQAGGHASPAAPDHPAASGTPVSAALAAQLEAQGHELLGEERYGQAIPVLKRALAATGESLASCLQPAGEPCLTYAYALYDLGRALLSSGAAAAAVGVLEHRLQIENQRPVVAAELEFARRRLG